MTNTSIAKVVKALRGLLQWLEQTDFNERVREIIRELEDPEINAFELQQLKKELSTENLFHPKCLGDVYVSGFVGDGTAFAWWNYLNSVAEICQSNL
ncbi:MAG: hypothetical protein K2N56_11220 [Oscillospiraceae bacterium]|nr:hypothetical protein [Oscillospiraceae bacterium]